jgi:hypothetical protein
LFGMAYGWSANGLSWTMPYLPWYFRKAGHPWTWIIVTMITGIGSVLLGCIYMLAVLKENWCSLPERRHLLDLVSLFLFAFHLVYFQFADRYLLILLPWSLIVTGQHLQLTMCRVRVITALACCLMLTGSAMWTRGFLSEQEALWTGAETVRLSGRNPEAVYLDACWTWNNYYGRFPAEIQPGEAYNPYLALKKLSADRAARARFRVRRSQDPSLDGDGNVIATIPYRDFLLRQRYVYVIERQPRETAM